MIDKLEFLLALAREQHFGRAAETCGVTQQTLSAGVKSLEDRFGVRLVQRGSRFQGFTPEGDRVLAWGRRIVGDARAMQDDVAALRKGLSGHLRIAAVPTALPMVAALTTPYRARYPNVRFSVLSTTSEEIFSLIDNLEADAGLTYLDNEPLAGLLGVAFEVAAHLRRPERHDVLVDARDRFLLRVGPEEQGDLVGHPHQSVVDGRCAHARTRLCLIGKRALPLPHPEGQDRTSGGGPKPAPLEDYSAASAMRVSEKSSS